MRQIWSIILLVALLSSCTKPGTSEPVAGKKIAWNALSLPGKTLSLIHPTKLYSDNGRYQTEKSRATDR